MTEKKFLKLQTVHEQLADTLREEILAKYKPGGRLPSVNALAERFGVSPLTLRIALVTLSEEGLLDRRPGSGCYVKDRQETKPIGILVGLDVFQQGISPFYLRVTGLLRDLLENKGQRVRVYIGHTPPGEWPQAPQIPDFTEDCKAGRLLGLAALGVGTHQDWLQKLQRMHVPVVGIDFTAFGQRAFDHCVNLDYDQFLPQATRYLVEQGRRRIASLGWQQAHGSMKRLFGEHGVEFRENWICGNVHPGAIGAGWEEFREVWNAYPEKPDGLIISDDMLFRDVQVGILELGIRVPEDLTIVTHANRGANMLFAFPVARLECDPGAVAEAMGDMLLKLVNKEPVPDAQVTVPFKLVTDMRETYGAARLQAGVSQA